MKEGQEEEACLHIYLLGWVRLARVPEQTSAHGPDCHIDEVETGGLCPILSRRLQNHSLPSLETVEKAAEQHAQCVVWKINPWTKAHSANSLLAPTPSSVEQLSALISFSGSEILDSINCSIPLALFASPILGSGTMWWAVTAGWSDGCCPIGFSSFPDPWLTLLCLCPSFWSSCSWISYPCCLSPLLV